MSDLKVMVITGARKGIGRHLSQYYAEKGVRVVGCSREKSEFTHENYRHFSLDVSDDSAVCNMFHEIRKDYGGLHYLVNNAGISSMNHSMLTPYRMVRKIFDTNTIGAYLMCREAAKLMSKKKFGRIVNFTTIALRMKIPGESAYLSSKFAVAGLTEVLAVELAELGITVNAIGPTPMRTDLIRNVPEKKIQDLLDRQPIKRLAEYADIVNCVDFFISPASDLVSGQTIYLGGL